MNQYLIVCLGFLLAISSCGYIRKEFRGDQGPQALPCSVSQNSDSSIITCPDGTTSIIPNGSDGKNGTAGSNGSNGVNGHSVVFSTTAASLAQCPTGGSVILLGLDVNDNLLLDTEDANLQSAIVCNGEKGDPGVAGPSGTPGQNAPTTPFTPVKLIAACGNASSPYKEQLLCLFGGSILASFSENASGKNTRFSLITAGTYQNTDSSGCVFTVTEVGGSSLVHWNSGSNQYGSWASGTEVCN